MKTVLRKNLGTGAMVLLLTLCFIPAAAWAAAPGDGRQARGFDKKSHHRSALGIWRDQQMIQELGLTEEQIKQIRDTDFTFRAKRLELKAKIKNFRLEMDREFSNDMVDDAAVLSLAEKIAGIKGKLFVQDIESRLALGGILNADQINKLGLYAMEHKKQRSKRGRKSTSKRHSVQRHDDTTPSDTMSQ